jgi:hypothetical protein
MLNRSVSVLKKEDKHYQALIMSHLLGEEELVDKVLDTLVPNVKG